MTHPTQEQLRQYVRGEVEDHRLQDLETHLDMCNACDETVEKLETNEHAWLNQLRSAVAREEGVNTKQVDSFIQNLLSVDSGGANPVESSKPIATRRIRDYELIEQIGQGGMGQVFRAKHTRLGREFAVKLIAPRKQRDEQAIARFQREMLAGGALAHPNIVQTTDAGEENGVYFLAMEYLHGADLKELIVRNGALAVGDACEIVRQTANGLAHAHQQDLVHRDIKPSNIMLVQSEGETKVKILDLGLARFHSDNSISDLSGAAIGASSADSSLTSAGQILGTLDYLAPEQARGETGDKRSDVYSLGAALYQLISGDPPHDLAGFDTAATQLNHVAETTPVPLNQRVKACPSELSQLVAQMMALDPADRIGSMEEVATSLSAFTQGANLQALLTNENTSPKTPPRDRTQPQPKSRIGYGLWAGLIAATIAIIALCGVVVVETSKGTVTVSGPSLDEDVTIVVSDDKKSVAVLSKNNGWKVRLTNGEYHVHVNNGDDRFKIENGVVTVTRMGRQVVEISKRKEPIGDPYKMVSDWIRKVRNNDKTLIDYYVTGELPSTGRQGEWGGSGSYVALPEEGVLLDSLTIDSWVTPSEETSEALSKCGRLSKLDMTLPISDAFVTGFSKGSFPNVKSFSITHRVVDESPPLSANQIVRLLNALPNVESLDITGTIRGQDLYRAIAARKKLKRVDIRSANGSHPAAGDLQFLSSLPELQILTLLLARADEAVLTEATKTKATTLSLENAILKPDDATDVLQPLAASGDFRHIHFSKMANLTTEKLEVFQGNKRIETVGLYSSPMITDDIIPILESMPNLKAVNIMRSGPGLTDEGKAKLKQMLSKRGVLYNGK